ncbi:DNA-directed RNA polymerase subunit D [Methanobrevibacter filiformis]|uniref:DNA-directed RNA polymerase subunit Rpo3 n=1 Tax=Methanobrevibacter filiformis TaxID=55758 RepID=A0A166A5C0_9EURY|nr:DNA-directed RNA polymerase subunit D [Methanobrevibacter filiformis]KZX11592.1 DNA-directed RNA polymerase subunit alpha [Methanobrevibacter filiformis]
MKIEVKEKNGDEIVFIIHDADVPFVNAIRRIAMMEIPKIAIEDVNIIKNDSAMFNEVLAHRLGLVPLVSDNEAIEGLVIDGECDCDDYCPKCSVSFSIVENGPGTVYSKDLTSTDSKIKPVHDTIPLFKLKEDQEVELEAVAKVGLGLEHAKWIPTTVCAYKQYPDISFDPEKEVFPEVVEACPRNILKRNKKTKKVTVQNIENCSMCGSCVRASENNAINVGFKENTFIFRIETDGSIPPEEVLLNACDVLNEKADKIITFCKDVL